MRTCNGERMRKALTLVEVLLAVAISGVVVGMIWGIYRIARRQSARLEGRLSGIQGAVLLSDRIRHDMARALFTPSDPLPMVESVAGGTANRLNILVYSGYRFFDHPEALYDPEQNDPAWIRGERVSYTFDEKAGQVTRNTPSGDELLGFARFARVEFILDQNLIPDLAPERSVTVVMNVPPEVTGGTTAKPVVFPIVIPLVTHSAYFASSWVDNYFDLSVQVAERKR
jgi:hypothetical protein